MTTIKAHFDGKSLILDQPVDLPVNQPLTLLVEVLSPSAAAEDQLQAFDEMLRIADEKGNSVDWSRESVYSGTLDDPR